MKVCVVDNGGQWTHRIWRVVRDLGHVVNIVPNTTPLEQIDADAMILSGGAMRVAFDSMEMGRCPEYINHFDGKLLGICAGMQIMAVVAGGKVGPASVPEFGLIRVRVLEEDELFKGLPKEFSAWASHNDEVKDAPGYITLAESENCGIEAMKHKTKPLYGVLFHPEVENTEYGRNILRNFLEL
jgi:GMP synthase (glutamine-hydrolysing)